MERKGRRVAAGVVGALLVGACSMLPQDQRRVTAGAPRPPSSAGAGRVRPDLPRGASLAIVWDRKKDADFLAHVDADSLAVKRRALLGEQGWGPPAVSPDGKEIAFGARRGGVRIHSVRTLKRLRSFHIGGGYTSEIMWPVDDQILLFTATYGMASAVSINPSTGKVIEEELLIGSPLRTKKTGAGLVTILGGPPEQKPEPSPAQLAFISIDGDVRYAKLDRIEAGWYTPDDSTGGVGEHLDPGLTVRDEIATIVGTDGEIAHVDLATMRVDYVAEDTDLMEQVADWLLPPAEAKMSDATSLWVAWYGDALVVSGYRLEMDVRKKGDEGSVDVEESTRGMGLMFVDPDTGDTRMIDERADRFARAGGKVFAYSTGFVADGRRDGIGLVAYGPRGEELWHAFGDAPIDQVTASRRFIYVRHGWSRVLRSVLTQNRGRILHTKQTFARVLHI